MENTMINYDRESILYKSAPQQATPLTKERFNADLVIEGTLSECIKEWFIQPEDQRGFYRLDTFAQEAFGNKDMLFSADMLAIATRDNFPKD